MSFNRQKYDDCNEMDYLKTSKQIADYQLDPPNMNINQCIPNTPLVMLQRPFDGYMRGSINDETDLFNINRPATKCPAKQYNPSCMACISGGYCEKCNNHLRFGTCDFDIDSTRNSNPAGNLRGTGYNRFDPITHNPQENIFFPGQQMINTRMVAKDNHRPLICTPKMNEMIPDTYNRNLPQVEIGKTGVFVVAPNLALYRKDVCG